MGGFCLATATTFAAARYNIWHSSGPSFQLGYIIGYLDAVSLVQKRDLRASVPIRAGKKYDRWVDGVNAYFEDPANQKREIADGIHAVGIKIRDEWLRDWGKKATDRAVATPVPSPAP